jgi:phosphatase NudJ
MARDPIPTWFFVVVVARLGRRFLLVHERRHGGGWYLPAGRVEPGETIVAAAVRETLEEAGVQVVVEGVLRFEHTPHPSGTARVRVVVVARPADDAAPRDRPNEDTLGAAWLTHAEIEALGLRGDDVLDVIRHVEAGGAVFPLSALGVEGSPYG